MMRLQLSVARDWSQDDEGHGKKTVDTAAE
jgi:hypothetical protein